MPLFPVLGKTEESGQSQQTFPAADLQNENKECAAGNLDWLCNSSYKPENIAEELSQSRPVSDQGLSRPENSEYSDKTKNIGIKRKDQDDDNDNSDGEKEKKHRKKHKKEKHKHRVKKHKHKSERSRSSSPSPQYSKGFQPQEKVFQHGNKVFIEEIPGLEAKDAYRIDRKPNKNNFIYGSVCTTHVPKFRRHVDICLAGEKQHVVSLKETKDSGKHDKTEGRYYNKENRKLSRLAPHLVLQTKMGEALNSGKEFIAVSDFKYPTKNQDDNQFKSDIRDQLIDVKTQSYVHGVGHIMSQPVEEDNSIQNSYLWKKNADYNKSLRENPKDVKLWLEFVNFQDKYMSEDLSDESHSGSVNVKKLPQQVIHEKKVMILKKAMEANPSCVTLKLRYLEICQDSLEPSQVNKELEGLLFVYPSDIHLWRRYLLYNQAHLSTFSVSRVGKLYSTCLQKLIGYQEKRVFSRGSTENLDRHMLELFVSYCYFLRQAGHTEKAVGCFQALLEFNLFCPSSLENSPHEDKKSIFESFWDSGVARIGESNAKGWKYWTENAGASLTTPEEIIDIDIEKEEQALLEKNDPKWKKWLNIELLRQSVHWLPWRPDLSKDETEEDCQDMDRLVLYDDVSGVLFPLPQWLHLEAVQQFLVFLGIDLENSWIASINPLEGQSNMDRLSQVLEHVDTMAECYGEKQISPLMKKFSDKFLEQMVTFYGNNESSQTLLNAVRLRFLKKCVGDSKTRLKHVKKYAKSLFKETQNRSNLYLWGEYAMLLWILGDAKEARTVVETALSMHSGLRLSSDVDISTKCGFVRLHRILAEILLKFPPKDSTLFMERIQFENTDLYGVVQQAQWGLRCMVENKSIKNPQPKESGHSVSLLITEKMKVIFDGLIESLKKHLSSGNESLFLLEYICEFTRCYAILAWLEHLELRPSMEVLDSALSQAHSLLPVSTSEDQIKDTSPFIKSETTMCHQIIEKLHQMKIKLILFHMSCLSAPLNCLRSALMEALKDFPSHPQFLWTFTQIELKSNISGRLDRYFSHHLKDRAEPIPLIIAVMSQVKRLDKMESKINEDDGLSKSRDIPETSMIHRIRTYLDQGQGSIMSQNCPLVWRLCLYAEVKYGKKERARGMFYQALQHCPWVKALYLDGVSLFGEEKLDDITDLLMEKELRLQIPLEEVDILLGQA